MDLKTVLEEIKAKKAVIVDVREKDEWDIGHLKDAQLFPMTRINKGEIPELPSDIPVYIHCAKGGRAKLAFDKLKSVYPNLIPLVVEYPEFKKAGFPTE